MFVIISPAKKLDERHPVLDSRRVPVKEATGGIIAASRPHFLAEAKQLQQELLNYDVPGLMRLMGISEKLAQLNHQRYRELFNTKEFCAIYLFQGDTYLGLQAETLDKDDLQRAQQGLRIISGFYGLLRPLDLINPHRLEIASRLPTAQGNNLYDFWGDKLAKHLIEQMQQAGCSILINCASPAYAAPVTEHQELFAQAGIEIVTPKFYDISQADAAKGELKYKVIGLFAKKARGALARYVVRNNITKLEQLAGFNWEGYGLDAAASSASQPVFRRRNPPASQAA